MVVRAKMSIKDETLSQRFETWIGHAATDGWEIFAFPFLHLFLHFIDLCRIECPKTALSGGTTHLVLHLLEALVQGQVVAYRIFPSIRCCLRSAVIDSTVYCK